MDADEVVSDVKKAKKQFLDLAKRIRDAVEDLEEVEDIEIFEGIADNAEMAAATLQDEVIDYIESDGGRDGPTDGEGDEE